MSPSPPYSPVHEKFIDRPATPASSNKRVSKEFPALPLWRRPTAKPHIVHDEGDHSDDEEPLTPHKEPRKEWLREEAKATEYLGVFYGGHLASRVRC